MKSNLRSAFIGLAMLGCTASPAIAAVSVSIGINLPTYPRLVAVPGYPVYYAPAVDANYFFYDGLYWVFNDDAWYSSRWYNGPWTLVDPYAVPAYVLRVPVRYYRRPPVYFRSWRADAAPRWGDHWGRSWTDRRGDWNRWDRSAAPAAAPLPNYQRQYSGSRYPQPADQAALHERNYQYRSRDAEVRQGTPMPSVRPPGEEQQIQRERRQQQREERIQQKNSNQNDRG